MHFNASVSIEVLMMKVFEEEECQRKHLKSKTISWSWKWLDIMRKGKDEEDHMFQQYVLGNFPNITSPGRWWCQHHTTAAQIVADSCFLKYFAVSAPSWWLDDRCSASPSLPHSWLAARLQICVQIRSSTGSRTGGLRNVAAPLTPLHYVWWNVSSILPTTTTT